jgi:hypothetical protein
METSKTNTESSNVPLREVRRVARRAERCHEDYDAAEPQAIREWLWRELMGEFDPEIVRAIYPLIVSARRIALSERNRAEEHEFTSADQTASVIEMFGAFPPVRALDAPLKPVDI